MKRSKAELNALGAAYDICWLMEDHSKNVLASGEKNIQDIENLKQSSKFVKWYQKNIISKTPTDK